MHRTRPTLAALIVAASLGAARIASAQNFDSVKVTTTKLADGVYMLMGAGGNMGLSVGPDAAFLIDDEYAPLTPKIKAAVAAVSDKPIKFVLNTHWHGDHTGGNKDMGEAGALIIAHENVYKRMSTAQMDSMMKRSTPASPKGALPVVTFTDRVTFHLNGDTIHAIHVNPAHTDGDAVIHFVKANVLHMGDTYFTGMYPFIDASSGGSLDGYVTVADQALRMIDDNTKVIPGHGALSNKRELKEFRDMLATVRDRIKQQISAGKTLDQVVASKPTAEFDAKWGKGFMKADQFVALAYVSLARR
jgi:glyoxylase-like metal-dependent hydrolase (beta-lactamase superfamily II)